MLRKDVIIVYYVSESILTTTIMTLAHPMSRGYDNIDCEYDHSRNGDDYDDYYDGGSDDGDVGDSSNDDNDEDGEVWRSRFNA